VNHQRPGPQKGSLEGRETESLSSDGCSGQILGIPMETVHGRRHVVEALRDASHVVWRGASTCHGQEEMNSGSDTNLVIGAHDGLCERHKQDHRVKCLH